MFRLFSTNITERCKNISKIIFFTKHEIQDFFKILLFKYIITTDKKRHPTFKDNNYIEHTLLHERGIKLSIVLSDTHAPMHNWQSVWKQCKQVML